MKKSLIRKAWNAATVNYALTCDDEEILKIIHAVTQRYKRKYPDWDVSFLSLPTDPIQRKEQLELMIAFLKNHSETSEQ